MSRSRIRKKEGPGPEAGIPLGRYPERMRALESNLVENRRRVAFPGRADLPDGRGKVGLALSGGGIRSATFGLGVLQALARLDILREVDYLSTVSGGGFIGSFLGGLFCRASGPGEVEAGLRDMNAPGLRWLRDNGRYLTSDGSGDVFTAGGTLVRNWLTVQLVMGLFLLMLLLIPDAVGNGFGYYKGFLQRISSQGSMGGWLPSPWFRNLPFLALVSLVPFGLAYWIFPTRKVQGRTFEITKPGYVILIAAILLSAGGAFGVVSGHMAPRTSGIHLIAAILLTGGLFFQAIEEPSGGRAWVQCIRVLAAMAGTFFLVLGIFIEVTASDLENFLVGLAVSCFSATLFIVLNAAQPENGAERERATKGLRFYLIILALGVAFALVDSAGWVIHGAFFQTLATRLPASPSTLGAAGAAIDLAHGTSVHFSGLSKIVASVVVFVGVLLLALSRLPNHAPHRFPAARRTRTIAAFKRVSASVAAILLGFLLLASLSAVAHSISFRMSGGALVFDWTAWALVWGCLLLVNLGLGHTFGFLNLSTLSTLYSDRLTRAYLGASNPARTIQGQVGTAPDQGDDITAENYHPHLNGGPLHLVNVTLNESIGGTSQVVQRDRHGMNVALGPAALSVGTRHHAERDSTHFRFAGIPPGSAGEEFAVFGTPENPRPWILPEPLTQGQWMGISGAAFSTGMGSRTCLPSALVMGILNLRLGYWWWSGSDPSQRGSARHWRKWNLWRLSAWFPTQVHLLHEWTARFPGTSSRHWNLSDGGHFENLAAYELIRRRLPVLVVVDAGADPDYALGDLENLVRKARIDLQAEIRFLGRAELDRLPGNVFPSGTLGTLDDLRRGRETLARGRGVFEPAREACSKACAALARITYDPDPSSDHQDPDSWLVYLKPAITGAEALPLDILRFHEANPDFPQEGTQNQFFSEAQWESYRKLGEWTALRVLGSLPGAGTPGGALDLAALLDTALDS